MKHAVCLGVFALVAALGGVAAAQPSQRPTADAQAAPADEAAPAPGITPPAGYVIGPEDVLEVVFWREKDLSGQVMVRPDGMVSFPLLNDVQAAGLTPDEFRQKLLVAASRYVENPSAAVIVRQINSRKVFITGEVNKPGAYALGGQLNVLQLLTLAGGLKEYADEDKIAIMRTVDDKQVRFLFNYKDVVRGRHIEQNIQLEPGDTVIVP